MLIPSGCSCFPRCAGRPAGSGRIFEQKAAKVTKVLVRLEPGSVAWPGAVAWQHESGSGIEKQSVRVVRQSIAQGYRSLAGMSVDADFSIVRDRPDFRALLVDLAFPDDPFAPRSE